MMMSALTMIVASGVGFASVGHDHELCEGFVPENTLKIPVGKRHFFSTKPNLNGGLTEAQFNAVIDRAEKLYGPVVQKEGGTLKVNRRWSDPTVNASAQRMGTTYVVNMYGGLARHAATTEEGFALVVCHELGHHIGGAPKIAGWYGDDWASNEGGSDYFATLKCLRNFFAEDDNEAIIANATIDPFAKETCEKQFTTREDQLICLRNSLAAESVAYLFMDLRKEAKKPMFNTPDSKVAARMDDNHPATQCRMDTYFAGAICNVDKTVPVSNTSFADGACMKETHEQGARPLCWFFPNAPIKKPKNTPPAEEGEGETYY